MFERKMLSKFNELYDVIYEDGTKDHSKIMKQISCLFLMTIIDQIESAYFILNMETVFTKENEKLRWKNFTETTDYEMYCTVKDEVYPFIISYIKNYKKDEKLYSLIKDQHLYINNKKTLRKCVSIIDYLYDTFGNKTELLGYGFLYLLKQRDMNEYFKIHNISYLIACLMKPSTTDVLYNPFSTNGSLLSTAALNNCYKKEYNDDYEKNSNLLQCSFLNDDDCLFFTYITFILHGFTNLVLSDYQDKKNIADVVITQLPLNKTLSKTEFEKLNLTTLSFDKIDSNNFLPVFMKCILESLKDKGKCACIVPIEFLESEEQSMVDIRKELVEENNIQYIIRFPHRDNEIPKAIVIFEKGGKTSKVYFYDTEDYIENYVYLELDSMVEDIENSYFEISKEELIQNNYNFAYDFIV